MSAVAQAASGPRKIHCDLDDWDFDPQYTSGACPICGWAPEGALKPKPAWQVRLEALPWDLIFLVILALVLIALAVLVGINARINLLPKGY